jgi:hypothetical protein
MFSLPMTAIVGGDEIPNRASASYCATLEISSCSARSPLAILRPWRANGAGVLAAVAVVARVRGRAHPVVEDTCGWLGAEIQGPAVEEPLRIRYALRLELAAQGLEPRVVLVDHVHARGIVVAVLRQFATHRSLLGKLWDPPGQALDTNIVLPGLPQVQRARTSATNSPPLSAGTGRGAGR